MENNEGNISNVVTFLIGTAVGAAVALLLAPQSGAKLRRTIGSYASTARDEIQERGREAFEQGREYVEKGKELLEGKEYDQAGKTAVRQATESTRRRS